MAMAQSFPMPCPPRLIRHPPMQSWDSCRLLGGAVSCLRLLTTDRLDNGYTIIGGTVRREERYLPLYNFMCQIRRCIIHHTFANNPDMNSCNAIDIAYRLQGANLEAWNIPDQINRPCLRPISWVRNLGLRALITLTYCKILTRVYPTTSIIALSSKRLPEIVQLPSPMLDPG